MKRWKKGILLGFVAVVLALTLCGCGFNFNESTVNKNVQTINPIPNGEYEILDTREQISGNNIRVKYHLTIVLQNSNGNRYYYEYNSKDEKNSTYIHLATFVLGDKITYQDGVFELIK